MDYRGTVQGGVVVLEPGLQLPEGQVVDIIPLPLAGVNGGGDLPGAGLWRDRTDLGDTADAARALRRATHERS